MFGCCCSSKNGKTTIIAALLAAGVTIGVALLLRSSDAEKTAEAVTTDAPEVIPSNFAQPEDPMEMDPMMAAMAEWGALAPEHEMLKALVGNWDCTTKFWLGGEEPIVGEGTNTSDLILGGRYVTHHFVMPDFMGSTFEGMGAVGYDKQKGKYVTVWLDSMSTIMSFMEGEWDEDTSTLTWIGTVTSPMGESMMKQIVKVIDEDNYIMEFWEAHEMTGGEYIRTGEITYTRSE